jgi:hypothetical protein
MHKRMFVIMTTIALLMSMAGWAAAGDDTMPPRQSVPVANVEIRDTLDATTFFITGTLPDSCNELMWAYQWSNGALFIDLYREVRPEVACAVVETPYEFVLPLETLIDEEIEAGEQFVMVFNNFMLRVDWVEQGSLPYSLQLSRGTVRVETINISEAGDSIRLTGQMGCGYLIARANKDWAMPEASVTQVEAYLAIDPAMMCIAGFVPFEVSVPSPLTDSSVYSVNGFMLPQDTTRGEGAVYVISDMAVDAVNTAILESFPPQVSLTARGITDGCEFPIQVVIDPIAEGSTFITARVARVQPLGIACPMMAVPFEVQGSMPVFTPGEYTVIVNEVERGSVRF